MPPKNKHLSSSSSLQDQFNSMIRSHNMGEVAFYSSLFEDLDIKMKRNKKKIGKAKVQRRSYQSKKEVKIARRTAQPESLKSTKEEEIVHEALKEYFGATDESEHYCVVVFLTPE